jgi:hypothetical protein
MGRCSGDIDLDFPHTREAGFDQPVVDWKLSAIHRAQARQMSWPKARRCERALLRLRAAAASIHRHAGDAQHLQGRRIAARRRPRHSGHAGSDPVLGRTAFWGLPGSVFVVIGVGLLLLVLTRAGNAAAETKALRSGVN